MVPGVVNALITVQSAPEYCTRVQSDARVVRHGPLCHAVTI